MKYNLELSDQDLEIIAKSLCNEPYGMVCRLIENINLQVQEQITKLKSENEDLLEDTEEKDDVLL